MGGEGGCGPTALRDTRYSCVLSGWKPIQSRRAFEVIALRYCTEVLFYADSAYVPVLDSEPSCSGAQNKAQAGRPQRAGDRRQTAKCYYGSRGSCLPGAQNGAGGLGAGGWGLGADMKLVPRETGVRGREIGKGGLEQRK